MLFESNDADMKKILDDIRCVVQETQDSLHHHTMGCVFMESHCSDATCDRQACFEGTNELHFNVLGYKNNEAETNCSYCIDKVALPENKVVRDTSGDRYSNGCAHFSDSTSDHEGSFISTFESNATMWKCLLEEFEQLKLEKDNMSLDLESTKAQLQEEQASAWLNHNWHLLKS
ncbi:Filament-like plant protein 4 [Camellia lanceoleosa]|uniref:Filament-like plant protein 4 n=1 Tax=Camellia lanceoleosa TaxID=1840588 RepID=A0ACC0FUP7_9ERIC|nr:Filament-like plant protein 4 [Camellia lanceoleosa]